MLREPLLAQGAQQPAVHIQQHQQHHAQQRWRRVGRLVEPRQRLLHLWGGEVPRCVAPAHQDQVLQQLASRSAVERVLQRVLTQDM